MQRNIILEHDGSPGGEIAFDGSSSLGDNLGSFEWNIYHLPEDTLAYTSTGSNPIIDKAKAHSATGYEEP